MPRTDLLDCMRCGRFSAAPPPRFEKRIVLREPLDPVQSLFKLLTLSFRGELPKRRHKPTAEPVGDFQPDHQLRLVEQFLAARFRDRYVTGFSDKTPREENA